MAGGSYGGFMSLASLTHYSDRLKAGIDIVGISNFVTFLENTQAYRRDLRRAEYGDERIPEMRSFLEKISPLSSVEKIKVPLLVIQGKNDPRVPASESDQMVAAVRKGGGTVWYIVGKDEGHGFAKKVNQDYAQYAEILFLKRHLLGEESSSTRPISGIESIQGAADSMPRIGWRGLRPGGPSHGRVSEAGGPRWVRWVKTGPRVRGDRTPTCTHPSRYLAFPDRPRVCPSIRGSALARAALPPILRTAFSGPGFGPRTGIKVRPLHPEGRFSGFLDKPPRRLLYWRW